MQIEDHEADVLTLYNHLDRRQEKNLDPTIERDGQGIPRKWVARIRESMARLTHAFSANRAVREYIEKHYLPAAAEYLARAADGAKLGADLLAWREQLDRSWQDLRFGPVRVEPRDGLLHFDVPVDFGALNPDVVHLELFAESQNGGEPVRQVMERAGPVAGNAHHYSATMKATRNPADFTPRVVPFYPHSRVPLEAPEILWRK